MEKSVRSIYYKLKVLTDYLSKK